MEPTATVADTANEVPTKTKKNYRKEKPWDTPDINKWEITPMTSDQNKHGGPVVESDFRIAFPKYRERYLQECWPTLENVLKPYGVVAELDLRNGRMVVKTSRKMYDPYIIFKSRDCCKLLARSVPYQEAVKVLQDDICSDVIKIGGFTRNKDRFIRRRARLVGPHGSTLKALEIVTECYFLVQGSTVSLIGPWKRMKLARRIIEECMSNKTHPVYHVKQCMVRTELEKNEEMAEVSWNNYLPQFGSKKMKSRKTSKGVKPIVKKVYPPTPTARKIDEELNTGEYFIKRRTDKSDDNKEKKKNISNSDKKFKKKEKKDKKNSRK